MKYFFLLLIMVCLHPVAVRAQNSDDAMRKIILEKRAYNQQHPVKTGFRIQLYNGLSQNKANAIREVFAMEFPDIASDLVYEQPEWKVQTRTYKTRLQAYKDWLKIREVFKATFIFEVKPH